MAKPRTFTPEFKAQVVLEVLSGVKSSAELCREHHLKSETLAKWRTTFLENAAKIFHKDEHRSQEQARIAELERVVGRLTLELEVAKKASSFLSAHLNRSELRS